MFLDPVILILLIIIMYVIILILLKKLEIGKKRKCDICTNCCPDCTTPLNRTRRNIIDKIIYHLAFRIFDLKRYSCSNCGWDGLRWEKSLDN